MVLNQTEILLILVSLVTNCVLSSHLALLVVIAIGIASSEEGLKIFVMAV